MQRIVLTALLTAGMSVGCATAPEVAAKQQEREESIETILSRPLDPEAYGVAKGCLDSTQYRSYRVLDDRRVVFEGRRGEFWLNTLHFRCPELRHSSALQVKSRASFSRRICEHDTFLAGDWFDHPWYRRAPWRWTRPWGMETTCSLGKFQPVSSDQVSAIEAALKGG